MKRNSFAKNKAFAKAIPESQMPAKVLPELSYDQVLIKMIDLGFTVNREFFDRHRAWLANNSSCKFTIRSHWNGATGAFIGRVSDYTANSKWIDKPVPAYEFLKNWKKD